MRGIGAWLIHPFLVLSGKVAIDSIPGITQPMSWTICNLSYCLVRNMRQAYTRITTISDSLPLIAIIPHVPLCYWDTIW